MADGKTQPFQHPVRSVFFCFDWGTHCTGYVLACKPVISRQLQSEIVNPSEHCSKYLFQFLFFHHRLFWPKSKSYDYLYSDGETLLRNFPVQATICFYEESDSEDEEEEHDDWEDEEDNDDKECLKYQDHFCNYN